eukprot:TRINITY_DN64316_c0_g1_i1.p1 TRINITY_DN64316_c0_g1~~TRINITY_DN64316_c0_g1_i1.p1  ORF type:complete len:115 (-),score=9.61 TRINITY_DN64316_c0_g1_i1:77-421(-)
MFQHLSWMRQGVVALAPAAKEERQETMTMPIQLEFSRSLDEDWCCNLRFAIHAFALAQMLTEPYQRTKCCCNCCICFSLVAFRIIFLMCSRCVSSDLGQRQRESLAVISVSQLR